MKVQAKEMLYYEHKRRREGEKFMLSDPKHFSNRSMIPLENNEPLSFEKPSQKKKKSSQEAE